MGGFELNRCVCEWVIWWILDNKLWSKCKQLAPETGSIEREIQLFELWLSVASRGLLAFTFNFLQTLISIQLFLLKWESLTSWFRTDYLVCSSEPRIISQWLISTRNGGIFKGTGQSVCHISSTPTACCHQDACWHRFLQQSRTCKTWLHPNLGWTAAMSSTFQVEKNETWKGWKRLGNDKYGHLSVGTELKPFPSSTSCGT